MRVSFGLALLFLAGWGGIGMAQNIHGRDGIALPAPPAVEAIPVADDYFGIKIPDGYRWLEDARSTKTRDFIDAQNAYTARYLKQARIRPQVLDDLDELENVSQARTPIERAGSFFFLKRLAGEQQFSIFVRHGLTGKDERLVDPAALSKDANTSVGIAGISRDGGLLAYRMQQGGADESSIHVLNVRSGKTLEDELPTARYQGLDFAPDGASFYYARHDKDGTLLYQHVLGTRSSKDTLIFGREFRGEPLGPNDLFSGEVTDDGRYLVIEIERGVPARRVDIVFRDLSNPGSPFDLLVWGLDARFSSIYAKGAWYVKTDYNAPKGKILKADPGILPDVWTTVVPEGAEVIEDWSIVGGKIYVNRLNDVKTETAVYTLEGKPAGRIDYEGIGSASILSGRTTDRYGYFSFSSYIVPPTSYRLDTVTGKREVFFRTKVPFDSSQYELKQVFFKSKDGTQVPMFIAGKKGLKQDGTGAAADDRLWRLQRRARRPSGAPPWPGGWSRAAGLQCPTCAAGASMARAGTSRACLKRSRMSSTTGLRRRST